MGFKFGVWGFGFRVSGLGFEVWVWGLGFQVLDLVLGVRGLGFEVGGWGSGFDLGFGFCGLGIVFFGLGFGVWGVVQVLGLIFDMMALFRVRNNQSHTFYLFVERLFFVKRLFLPLGKTAS